LLYAGLIALKGNLSQNNVFSAENIIFLFSIYYVASPYYYETHAEYAHELLCVHVFVERFGKIYGKSTLVYNIHGLIYLAADGLPWLTRSSDSSRGCSSLEDTSNLLIQAYYEWTADNIVQGLGRFSCA